jgi:hypothetical protein
VNKALQKQEANMAGRRNGDSNAWEPRVAKLETSMEMLTNNVNTLTNTVREQGTDIEKQLRELAISVNAAAGPKKTDWGLMLGAVGLALAIGAAVFAPLNLRISDNQKNVESAAINIKNHEILSSHPVSDTRLNYIESSIKEKQRLTDIAIDALNTKLQTEWTTSSGAIKERITILENWTTARQRDEFNELRDRRMTAEKRP